jgi:FkbM family methyltransferase
VKEAVLRLLAEEDREPLARACEARARAVYLGNNRVLCRILGGYPLVADGRDNGITPHLALSGHWELWCTMAVARYVRPGMRCLDVGASTGYYTVLLAALTGEEGYVQAWEPAEFARECLHCTVELNGFEERVEIVAAAASDGFAPCGAARLVYISPRNLGSAEVRDALTEGQAIGLQAIDLLWQGGPPDFVKIDVEGHEARVWQGARRILSATGRRAVLLEFTPAKCKNPSVFLQSIADAGYTLRTLDADGHVETREISLDGPGYTMLWLQKEQ